jgi:hypothetical protein
MSPDDIDFFVNSIESVIKNSILIGLLVSTVLVCALITINRVFK